MSWEPSVWLVAWWWWLAPAHDALPMSRLEIVAVATGLWSVACYVRESVWAWPAGLINVALSIALYWHSGLYAETALQAIFVWLQLYGWWQWLHGGALHTGVVIVRTSRGQALALVYLALAAIIPVGYSLDRWTDSTVPWWDTVPVVLSLVAQWMISKKLLENWMVWIAVDLISIPLFIHKELYLVAGLYGVFLILCILGLLAWRRNLRSSPVA